ncbi:MAG: amidohydrolase family protein [Phycisphaerales bacterium]|nr:amidohydrolase family protein [Phycisphaerales bacterium]
MNRTHGRSVRVSCAMVFLVLAGLLAPAAAEQVAPPANGPRRNDPAWHALVHATLVPAPGEKIEDATVVLRDGVIVSVQKGAAPPAGARVWDCKGLSVYAGLVEPYAVVDAPRPPADEPGAHWNPRVMAQRSALDGPGLGKEARKKLRELGYAAAAIAPRGGVFRGRGAVVSLGEEADPSTPLAGVVAADVFHTVALEFGGPGNTGYPDSKMGAIALVRQTLSDAPWYARAVGAYTRDPARLPRPTKEDALAALNTGRPLLFDVETELDVLRVAKIAAEFSRPAMVVGCGTEFRRIEAVKATGLPIAVPLRFPKKPRLETEASREAVSLRELMTWEQAPTNPRRLDAAGVEVSLTSSKLPAGESFFTNLREAIKAGLGEERALAMLTTNPAKMLGLSARLGAVRPGMAANLVVVKGGLFDEKRQIRDVWVDGLRYEVNPAPAVELKGSWAAALAFGGRTPAAGEVLAFTEKNAATLERPKTDEERKSEEAKKAEGAKPEAEKEKKPEAQGDAKPEAKAASKPARKVIAKAKSVSVNENRVDLIFDAKDLGVGGEGLVMLSAVVEGEAMIGRAVLPGGGAAAEWSARRSEEAPPAEEKKGEDKEGDDEAKGEGDKAGGKPGARPEAYGLPFGPFALDALPEQPAAVLVTNATIWTSGPDGIIEKGDLLVEKGKIVYAGKSGGVSAPAGAVVIDAAGRHVTPGLIDCHSHTGISEGVNEGTHSATAEVRIFDVIDPDAIGWYRELAGGLTAVNQLHGSANSIGGQNSVVKIRWGVKHPDEMRLEGAAPGIKFALGENVKQSNWGESNTTRYPQTRMGVETFIVDRFTAAREYAAKWKAYEGLSEEARQTAPPPRRDLQLEALAEILAGVRLVHCHSYRQDEILMLCRVAEQFGFRIGTFQHVLEGYKVADAIRKNAIGGSAFSDWWAYKFEVFDAVPYAGEIMHNVGVVVSFNSDSDELARRMNVEAAKAVKYGNIPPAEALKFVTLNPAQQLKIDGRVGSLEKGKDADFVIWSGPPLSSYSRCESTWIDGREYFSLKRDAELRAKVAAERRRLIAKALGAKGPEAPSGTERAPRPTRQPEMVDEPPTGASFTAGGGRGRGLTPAGGAEDPDSAAAMARSRALEAHFQWLIRNGMDPFSMFPGDCGCSMHSLFSTTGN